MNNEDEARAHVRELHDAVWELAATSLALRDPATTDVEQRLAAEQVVAARGVLTTAEGDSGLAAQAATAILQSAAVLSGADLWTGQDDEAILAQGRASAQGVEAFKVFGVPMMEGLPELLSGSSPVMLDVGVGVAAMAVAYCEAFPNLRVVGLDVFPRALEVARLTVDDAGMGGRIELRQQDVATLEERDHFCLAWLPAPFIPRPAIDAGLPRIVNAIVPGGWLVVGHGKLGDGALHAALARFQTVVFGGTALNNDEAQDLLRDAGLVQVTTMPTPDGAPAITIGRRPPAS